MLALKLNHARIKGYEPRYSQQNTNVDAFPSMYDQTFVQMFEVGYHR